MWCCNLSVVYAGQVVKGNTLMAEEQNDFRRGRSGEDNLSVMMEILKTDNTKRYFAYLNIEKKS